MLFMTPQFTAFHFLWMISRSHWLHLRTQMLMCQLRSVRTLASTSYTKEQTSPWSRVTWVDVASTTLDLFVCVLFSDLQ
jgi:hypothetical protein